MDNVVAHNEQTPACASPSILLADTNSSGAPNGVAHPYISANHNGEDEPPSTTIIDNDDAASISTTDGRPELLHKLSQESSSVMSLAIADEHIYAGTSDGQILVYSLGSYELIRQIKAHRRSVLCLFLAPDSKLLWSSGGGAVINAWNPRTMERVYHIYSTHDTNDIYCVTYSQQFQTLYLGAVNTSIQWCNMDNSITRPAPSAEGHPDTRSHRFFDSVNLSGATTPRPAASAPLSPEGEIIQIDPGHYKLFAHYSIVTCMLLVDRSSKTSGAEDDMLISGSADGTIKVWKLSADVDNALEELFQLGDEDAESVWTIAVDGSFLYSGKDEGVVELWDLDTQQKLRVIDSHAGHLRCLQMGFGFLWTAGTSGELQKFGTVQYGRYSSNQVDESQNGQCLMSWHGRQGKILASIFTNHAGEQLLITGGYDDISVWSITKCVEHGASAMRKPTDKDKLVESVREFVAFKTVSSMPDHSEDCRKAATWLRALFETHGAQTEMWKTDKNNPVVFARFPGNPRTSASRKRILFYGHYDVVAADNKQKTWTSSPFELDGRGGYLYGRGVSDNKGPILAAMYAVADCLKDRSLEADVIFVIEGEEECGSRGFKDAVRVNKHKIGKVDYILLANSYWIDDAVPCLTYGLRGVLHATIKVSSGRGNLHSGVDGNEMDGDPVMDLTKVIAKLKDHRSRILIPGFYDKILPLSSEEEARYDEIVEMVTTLNPGRGPAARLKESLMSRWRAPNLTIHNYHTSGPDGSIVHNEASSAISLRLVPKQEVEEIILALRNYLQSAFDELDSRNQLTITIDNYADAWLGDPKNDIFQTLEAAIIKCWGSEPMSNGTRSTVLPDHPANNGVNGVSDMNGVNGCSVDVSNSTGPPHDAIAPGSQSHVPAAQQAAAPVLGPGRKPLYIREGGSIPSIRFLEKEFDAPAAHLPCGQASDSAHLDNERLRLSNLYKSREIFREVFKELPKK